MKKHTRLAAAILCGAMLLQGCSSMLSSVLGTEGSTTGNGAETIGNILGSIIGTFGQNTNQNTIVGTWTYSKPAVQFESESLLAKAGGTVASAKIVQELEPYYKKLGITSGKMSITLNEDKTRIYGSMLKTSAAYVSVAGSQLSLTFDSTKLLTFAGVLGGLTGSGSTLSSIAQIAQNYDGMKTGFLFTK